MVEHITVHPAPGTWVVRAGGAVIAESTAAVELVEGTNAPVIFFPRADIAMAFLEPSETRTTHRDLGAAEHFSIVTKSTTLPDAAWSYAAPGESQARIKDHVAFHSTREQVAVEKV